MKRKSTLALVLVILLLSALLGGCGGGTNGNANIAFTDMLDRQVTLEGVPERVVVMSAAVCEIVYALGSGDSVVGRGEYCDWPAEALQVEAVASGSETNVEQIIALEPQVVFMSSMDQGEEAINQLEAAGIPVVVSEAASVEATYASIEMIGQALGKTDEAAALVQGMRDEFTALAELAAASSEHPSVYFEVSPLEYGLWAAGAGSFMDEIALTLGLENIFADTEGYGGWAEVSEEQVIERDPALIVSIGMYFGEGPTPDQEIMGRAGWQEVSAVKDGRILVIEDNALSRPGPRLAEGARRLYEFAYGAA